MVDFYRCQDFKRWDVTRRFLSISPQQKFQVYKKCVHNSHQALTFIANVVKKIRIKSIWIWSDLFKIHIAHLWLSRKHDDRCQKLNTSCCENVWLIKKSVVWTNGQWACERGPRLWYLSAHDTGDITHCSAIKRSTVSFKCNLRAYTISMTAYQFSSVQFIQESYKHVILQWLVI